MNELLRMFLSQKEIVDFFKRKQLSGKDIPSDELFRAIRSVKGLESLVAAKRTQIALITEGVITKTANHLYRVNADYDFSGTDKEKVDLKGWNIAHYKRDIPKDLIENETTLLNTDSNMESNSTNELELLRSIAKMINKEFREPNKLFKSTIPNNISAAMTIWNEKFNVENK